MLAYMHNLYANILVSHNNRAPGRGASEKVGERQLHDGQEFAGQGKRALHSTTRAMGGLL